MAASVKLHPLQAPLEPSAFCGGECVCGCVSVRVWVWVGENGGLCRRGEGVFARKLRGCSAAVAHVLSTIVQPSEVCGEGVHEIRR